MKTVVIKYNAGNVQSVLFALERIGANAILSDDAETISNADKVIFPGVGEAGSAMNYLKEKNLDKVIKSLTQPVLGICLGMQLLCAHSEESNTECLGIFSENVKRFPTDKNYKVPHVGWNTIYHLKSPLFYHCKEDYVYFVHSYYVETGVHSIAQCNYILPFSASIQKNNFYACQFHPEKSGSIGELILKNFMNLK
ncbi:MAG: imidazole glycerol phosphate synthase subunit HisH [Bacteroidia bacterium]